MTRVTLALIVAGLLGRGSASDDPAQRVEKQAQEK